MLCGSVVVVVEYSAHYNHDEGSEQECEDLVGIHGSGWGLGLR